ncbi:hypothetical protein [Glycomyces sp. NPDC048151]|uniref:restriction system modified-DNA reader domain-containing protein n=1 Tax=Glycomyces sp. NPDC048151 TaxID=3364002 RepID=UPI0037230E4C
MYVSNSVNLQLPADVDAALGTLGDRFGLSRDEVLQRVLGLSVDTTVKVPAAVKVPAGPVAKDGSLAGLVNAGLIAVGDSLTFERPRLGQVFSALVADRGWIELEDGRRFSSPSPAAEAYVGGSQSGWECWKHDKSDKTLFDLRDELKRNP